MDYFLSYFYPLSTPSTSSPGSRLDRANSKDGRGGPPLDSSPEVASTGPSTAPTLIPRQLNLHGRSRRRGLRRNLRRRGLCRNLRNTAQSPAAQRRGPSAQC